MKTSSWWLLFLLVAGVAAFIYWDGRQRAATGLVSVDSSAAYRPEPVTDTVRMPVRATLVAKPDTTGIDIHGVQPQEVVQFAQTLIGVPYKYASADPAQGFDCSGFITYVFHHFNILVPRSSIDFTNVGREVSEADARPGDLILFTGTDSTERFVGHMGIVLTNGNGQLQFIHSSSGKAMGVTITPLNNYYRGRYMKIVRVFL